MKTNLKRTNLEIEKLRQTIATTDFTLDVSEIGTYFCNPFFSSAAFFESTELLEDAELVDSLITVLLETLSKIGDECRMNMINSVLQSPNKQGAKQILDQSPRGDEMIKALIDQSETQVILLQVPGTDFIHGHVGNREIRSIIHYFARENTGLINTSFQKKEMYTSQFSIPPKAKERKTDASTTH